MSKIRRYKFYSDHNANCSCEFAENDKGSVVLHDDHLATIKALQEENEKIRASAAEYHDKFLNAKNHITSTLLAVVEGERDDLQDRVKELEALLIKYGRHSPPTEPICEYSKHSDYPCTCGFEQALTNKQEG